MRDREMLFFNEVGPCGNVSGLLRVMGEYPGLRFSVIKGISPRIRSVIRLLGGRPGISLVDKCMSSRSVGHCFIGSS